MSWVYEFGAEYAVPQCILDAHAEGKLVDASWHNDVSPSFARTECCSTRLWVEHPDPAQREYGEEWKRFNVSTGYGESLWEGEDAAEGIAVLMGLSEQALHDDSACECNEDAIEEK